MSSVVNPVGPEEPSTYWRRRAVVAVSLLVLMWLAWMGLTTVFGGSGEASAAGTPPTPIFGLSLSDPPADGSAAADSGDTEKSDGEAAGDETSQPDAGATADPGVSGAVTGSPTVTAGSDLVSGSPSPSPAATGRCAQDSVRVIVAPGAQTLTAGSGTSITMSVSTSGDASCTQDVGSGANEIKVISDSGKVVYSSDNCNPSKATKDTDLVPGSPWSATVTWDGRVSSPGCASAGPALQPGTYTVVARNGDIASEPVTLTVQ